jgi:ferredoxin
VDESDAELLAADGPDGLVVLIDRAACIGVGDCAARAPRAFAVDADRKVCLVAPAGESPRRIWEAARACPTDAILLEGADGTPLYP